MALEAIMFIFFLQSFTFKNERRASGSQRETLKVHQCVTTVKALSFSDVDERRKKRNMQSL
jgi:hypothetical protein